MFFLFPGLCEFFGGGEWWGTFFWGATEDPEWNFWGPTYVPFQQSWHKWIMVSLTMTVVSCTKSALSFSKPKKQWWVFSRVLSQNVKSVFLHKNLRYIGYYMVFFPCPPLKTGPSTYKEPTGLQSRPTNRGKKRERCVDLPSFPNRGKVLFVISFTSLVLLFKVSDFRCVVIFFGSATRSHPQTLTNLLFVVDDLLRWPPWFVGFHGCFFLVLPLVGCKN